jgi:archaellum component FlaC
VIWFNVLTKLIIIYTLKKSNRSKNVGTAFAQRKGLKMKTLIVIFLIFMAASLAQAEVYKWLDEKGIVHFTDDITQIPEKYRRTIKEVEVGEEKLTETKEEGEVQQKKEAEPYKDRLGRGEDYWKGRIEEWRKKLQSLQENLEALRVKYNELTEKFNASKSSAERAIIRNDREQIRSQMEKKIPDEASLYKARPEWVKP